MSILFGDDEVVLVSVDPRIVVDLRYATKDNFVGRAVYDFTECHVLEIVADKLARVQDVLEQQGLGLKIWDGYRPFHVQQLFWDIVQDERFIAHPAKGGKHTRGTAVDVTLIDAEGRELPMPTPFDEFTERAYRSYISPDPERNHNRDLLEKVMEDHGFIGLPNEWWHFDLKGWEKYPVLAAEKTL